MTQVLTRSGAPRKRAESGHATHSPGSPAGRRLQRPRWRDARLMTGLLLILASVALGGHLIGRRLPYDGVGERDALACRPGTCWRQPICAPCRPTFRRPPAVATSRLLPPALVGKTLSSPVQAGELLAADSGRQGSHRREQDRARRRPLRADCRRSPPVTGSMSTSSPSPAAPAAAANGREVRVLSAAEFVSEDVLNSGDTSVQLRVAAAGRDHRRRREPVRAGRPRSRRRRRPAADPADAGPSSVAGFGGS